MTQVERDRLVTLKKAKKKLITQKQAAEELGITERHVRRLLHELKRRGDKAVVHALRGLASNRGVDVETQREAVAILTRPVYRRTSAASSSAGSACGLSGVVVMTASANGTIMAVTVR